MEDHVPGDSWKFLELFRWNMVMQKSLINHMILSVTVFPVSWMYSGVTSNTDLIEKCVQL